jgi:poly-gamma-glutamate synthesis protein (capsule biosynthesis protein)
MLKQQNSSTTRILLSVFMATLLLAGCTAPASSQLSETGILKFDGEIRDPSMTEPPKPPQSPEPPVPPAKRALLSFAGDCTLSSMQGVSTFNHVYNSEGPSYFFSGVLDIFANDDLTIVNLEGPLTNETTQVDKGEPPAFWFRAPPEYVQILKDGSVEACNLANNHILDYGSAGLAETKTTLTEAGIDYFGYDDILIREINGIKIGFFGLAFTSNAASISQAIDRLRTEGAEALVAYFHDGIEREYTPSSRQIAAAHTAIDYGASAVIMSHPHVIQGTEEYNGGFIAYSLGNFCYGGHGNPADKDSIIIQLEFTRTDDAITCSPRIIPCSLTSTPGTNDYRPMVLPEEEAQRILEKIMGISP